MCKILSVLGDSIQADFCKWYLDQQLAVYNVLFAESEDIAWIDKIEERFFINVRQNYSKIHSFIFCADIAGSSTSWVNLSARESQRYSLRRGKSVLGWRWSFVRSRGFLLIHKYFFIDFSALSRSLERLMNRRRAEIDWKLLSHAVSIINLVLLCASCDGGQRSHPL
jgi:hypothetical protein